MFSGLSLFLHASSCFLKDSITRCRFFLFAIQEAWVIIVMVILGLDERSVQRYGKSILNMFASSCIFTCSLYSFGTTRTVICYYPPLAAPFFLSHFYCRLYCIYLSQMISVYETIYSRNLVDRLSPQTSIFLCLNFIYYRNRTFDIIQIIACN